MGTTIVIASHNMILMDKFNQHPRLILDDGQVRTIKPNMKPDVKNKLKGVY
jgi:ABC-type ATPase involved in cell division